MEQNIFSLIFFLILKILFCRFFGVLPCACDVMSRDVVLLDLFTCCVAPASSNQMGSRPRITRDMIGDPLRDSFQHVAHVGAAEVGEVDSVEPFKSRFAPSSSPQSSSESSSRLPSPTAAAASGAQQQMLKMNSKAGIFLSTKL